MKGVGHCANSWIRGCGRVNVGLKTLPSFFQLNMRPAGLNLTPPAAAPKQHHVADRRGVGQQHDEAVDADAAAAGGGMPYSSARMKSAS